MKNYLLIADGWKDIWSKSTLTEHLAKMMSKAAVTLADKPFRSQDPYLYSLVSIDTLGNEPPKPRISEMDGSKFWSLHEIQEQDLPPRAFDISEFRVAEQVVLTNDKIISRFSTTEEEKSSRPQAIIEYDGREIARRDFRDIFFVNNLLLIESKAGPDWVYRFVDFNPVLAGSPVPSPQEIYRGAAIPCLRYDRKIDKFWWKTKCSIILDGEPILTVPSKYQCMIESFEISDDYITLKLSSNQGFTSGKDKLCFYAFSVYHRFTRRRLLLIPADNAGSRMTMMRLKGHLHLLYCYHLDALHFWLLKGKLASASVKLPISDIKIKNAMSVRHFFCLREDTRVHVHLQWWPSN